jgi:hypothetical protein
MPAGVIIIHLTALLIVRASPPLCAREVHSSLQNTEEDNVKTPQEGSEKQTQAAQTQSYDTAKVYIHPRCEYDPTRKEEEFVRALLNFLRTQRSADKFRIILCPKRLLQFQCCWEIDPETGDLRCVPCEDIQVIE